MGDVSSIEALVINFNGLSSMTTNDYRASIESLSSSGYSLQYDNVFISTNGYLDLLVYSIILLIAIFCSGMLVFHLTVIVFSRLYLYRFSFPEHDAFYSTASTPTATSKSDEEPDECDLLELTTVPGVSIIKPLTGVDEAVLVNLRSFFYLDYPKYELLFCVADPDDPVVPHVQQLIKEHRPRVEATLIISESAEVCVNPKINNMNPAYLRARYELVLISDVGIYMYQNTLTDMVITMLSEDNVGLVHQIPFMFPYETSQHLLALEASATPAETVQKKPPNAWLHQLVYFGCWHAKMYMGAAMLGINCTTGMSCLMRKDALDSAGGMVPFGQYLAEDFFFSKFFFDSGWKVRVAGQPAWQHAIVPGIKQFQDRMIRWYQLRIAMVPVATLLEPFTGCFINGLLHAFCYSYLFPHLIDPVAFFLFHVLLWFLLDFIMLHQIHPPSTKLSINKASFLGMWAFYESTAIFTQLRALFTKDIHWRGKHYRLRWGGVAYRVDHGKELPSPPPKYRVLEATTIDFEEENDEPASPLTSSFEFSRESLNATMTQHEQQQQQQKGPLSPLLERISLSLPVTRPACGGKTLKLPADPCSVQ